MALQDLIARLDEDADATVRRVGQEAASRARAIEQTARLEHDRRTTDVVASRRRIRLAQLARELTEARRAARGRELDARMSLVDRILARARARVADVVATDTYRRDLAARCTDALSYLEGVPVRVRCRPDDAAVVSSAVAGREHVTIQPEEGLSPGLIIESLDGSVTIDETLEARLSRLRERLAIELIAEVDDGRP